MSPLLIAFASVLTAAPIEEQASGLDLVQVKTVAADVTVRTASSAVVTYRLDGGRTARRTRDSGRLTLEASSGHLELTLPRHFRLSISTKSGDVDLGGDLGRVDVHTMSGDVRVDGYAKDVEIRSISGSISAGLAVEILTLSAVSGDIRIKGSARTVSAQSTSGDVFVEVAGLRRVTLKSVSGDVRARGRLEQDASVVAESISGNVRLGIAGGQGYRIEANSRSGHISIEGATHEGAIDSIVRGGGADLKLRTWLGDIVVETE